MKLNTYVKGKAGMTLIELTIVILVLLTLISVLFIGAKAYKDGADNATCILNQEQVQKAIRSHQNMNAKNDGDTFTKTDIFGDENDSSKVGILAFPTEPTDPDTAYTENGSGIYPAVGSPYITCATTKGEVHAPESFQGW